MQLHDDFRYAVDGHEIGFGSIETRKELLTFGEIGIWLRSLPIIYQKYDILFVHGGFTSKMLSKFSIEQLNNFHYSYFQKEHTNDYMQNHILWSRDLAMNPENNICSNIVEVLNDFNSTKIVVGHTITSYLGFTPGHIGTRCSDKIILSDVGISNVFSNIPKLNSVVSFSII